MNSVQLIPWVVHEAVEYVAAALFLLAPVLFGFEDGSARYTSIGIGLVVLVVALISRGRLAVTQSLSSSAHVTLDYVLAVALVLAPFVLGFVEDTAAVTFFVLLGVGHAALTLLTRFPRTEASQA